MKKKVCAVLVAMVMCVSLVACGGVDKQPVIDAFNSASTAFDTVAAEINANAGAYPQEVIDVMTQMANSLKQCKATIESDTELTEEQAATLISTLNDIEEWVATVEAEVVVNPEEGAATLDIQGAADYFNAVSTMYDAAATVVNDNPDAFDEEFVNNLSGVAETLTQYKGLLESGHEFTQEEYDAMMKDLEDIGNWLLENEDKLFG